MLKPNIKMLLFLICTQVFGSIIAETYLLTNKPEIPINSNGPDDDVYRKFNYRENKRKIDRSNRDPSKGYKLKVNAFAQLSPEEFQRYYLRLIPSTPQSIQFSRAVLSAKNPADTTIVIDEDDDQLQEQNLQTNQINTNFNNNNQDSSFGNSNLGKKSSNINQANYVFQKYLRQIKNRQSTKKINFTDSFSIQKAIKQIRPLSSIQNNENQKNNRFIQNGMSSKIRFLSKQKPFKNRFLAALQESDKLLKQDENSLMNLQEQVLNQVRQYLRRKKVNENIIQEQIIQKYRFKGDLSELSVQYGATDSYDQNLYYVQNTNHRNHRLLQQKQNQLLNIKDMKQFMLHIKSVDWTCVSGEIRKQGYCGACYAFAAADCISSLMAIYTQIYHSQLSAQDLIDCASNSMAFGCQGGFLQGSYTYATQTGILSHHSYPYQSQKGTRKPPKKCKQIVQLTPRFKIRDYKYISSDDCRQLLLTLQRHPVSVAITSYSLAFYSNGVFKCEEEDTILNHAVLVIGFKKGLGWKLKNSWGTSWGRGGYFWLQPGNTCQICKLGFYPILLNNEGNQQNLQQVPIKTCPSP